MFGSSVLGLFTAALSAASAVELLRSRQPDEKRGIPRQRPIARCTFRHSTLVLSSHIFPARSAIDWVIPHVTIDRHAHPRRGEADGNRPRRQGRPTEIESLPVVAGDTVDATR